MASTIKTHEIITICPNTFGTFPASGDLPERSLLQLLRPYAEKTQSIANDGTQFLDRYMSTSGVLLHEMSHLLLGTGEIPSLLRLLAHHGHKLMTP